MLFEKSFVIADGILRGPIAKSEPPAGWKDL
jgi:hypothetical protein